jgi:hypothetical protein
MLPSIEEVCPVLPLARQHNELARLLKGDDDNDERLERMEELVEAASHVTPRSQQGAAFQLIAAHAEIDRTSEADAPAVRAASRKQVRRLLYRAASFLLADTDELSFTREHHISPDRDSALNRFGHMTAASPWA